MVDSRLKDWAQGQKIVTLDSITLQHYQAKNLADLLSGESSIFIKTYGLGSLATTSFRGGSANHTALLWNGLQLNSPMNGQNDYSLIPISASNEIRIQYGGSTALWGSGAIGGAIHLDNRPSFNQGLRITTGSYWGSYHDYRQRLSVDYSNTKYAGNVQVFYTQSKNDFIYTEPVAALMAMKRQPHAELLQKGILSNHSILIQDNQRLSFHVWHQETSRNLPPILGQPIATSSQADASNRFSTHWEYYGNRIKWHIKGGYFNEQINYLESPSAPDALSRSHTLIVEAESNITLSRGWLMQVGTINTYETATSDGYPHAPTRNRVAGFTSLRYQSRNNKSITTASFRQELMASKLVPATYSISNFYRIAPQLQCLVSISKLYRIPTFNDLYWHPGGNSNLQSEHGYSAEAGVQLHLQSSKKTITIDFEPTIFHRRIHNWILWLPEVNYWSPQNIMEVWSRGIETKSQVNVPFQSGFIQLDVLTNYVVSTNEKAKSANDASVDKQLIYVPMYSGQARMSFQYKTWNARYTHQYTGYRYTSSDNRSYLLPYLTAQFALSYRLNYSRWSFELFAQCQNIWNTDYEVILNRPMPGRNYALGLTIQFHSHSSQTAP